ncbi:immune inhibitor A domain-containing protein [Actinoplanes sp. TBRC 11911]|uniref:immune inhibitor A domain-containing protein n=1 Tax=Actinoplanes sp. TBRC 11911 TaxID=2729386 RepID=UPI0028A1543A|nr:immune inhibitor A domain-containing protein [Actinoplanes sp. TBRC 11911]
MRDWPALDSTTNKYYPKRFTLRAVGTHVEVWVAQDLAFPENDCRRGSLEVTDAQIAGLVSEFDGTIYPKETQAFRVPPDRAGSNATAPGDFTGDGGKTVTLVDNIRDENYLRFPEVITYTAGFFSRAMNELVDRNVITLDAYDWLHRLGANPPNDPSDDPCTNRLAKPRLYEATFAHEWQHLLEYYSDPAEPLWVNEGLSDYAQTLTGYVDGRTTVRDQGNDPHLICYQGFGPVKTKYNRNPRACGGPQNSLNLWSEDPPNGILADYGIAFQFMLYLRDRFGPGVITALHRDGERQGLAGVQAALPAGTSVYDVLHDFQAMTLVDKVGGDPGAVIEGVPARRITAASLRSTVNLDNKSAYDTPGAAPNGADYVPLPTPLRSVVFEGAETLPPLPSGWTVAGGTLFSGNRADLDSYAVRRVTVPAADPTLTLETAWGLEPGNDWAYVTVSTDGGKTYRAVAGDRTQPGPWGPALTDASGPTVTVKYDLRAYGGSKILIGLRYVSDDAVNKGGWRIGRITLGGSLLSDGSDLRGWTSPTAIVPTRVHAWHVTLAGLGSHRAKVVPLSKFKELKHYPKVVAIVSYDEPTELMKQYAPYRLTANGVLQPGGSTP